MKNNRLLTNGEKLIRLLDKKDNKAFVVDCKKQTMPKWVDEKALTDFEGCGEDKLEIFPDVNDLDVQSRKLAHKHFTYIAGVLPFLTDKKRRCEAIRQITEEQRISKQTVCNYLWLYLVHQNISALAPKNAKTEDCMTDDEKNMRWALNKFFYTQDKNSLNTAYTLMLKEKYCNADGTLLPQYPSFYQFRYYYRNNKKLQNYYISRNGIKNYQRNNRPLLGDGVQEFAPAVGVEMLDSTVCDIYLVNDEGSLVGRPILTACVDAYSGLCCGYSLSWEGGVYSLRNLMINVISDKKEYCKKFGISINSEDWNCHTLPATLVTDMGKEYVSDTFEQITDLGVTLVNLPPYRPELKGVVEKFFDVVQNLYKPNLKGKGVIEPDYRERGAHDYRKDARLAMSEFERIILHCIVYYNSKRVLDNFPLTEDMLENGVKPYASEIWNYGITQDGANLIKTDRNALVLTLLPRTIGKFGRKGLTVNNMRYKNEEFTERYLTGGSVDVAYNPEDVSQVWFIENGAYIPFTLIENCFYGKTVTDVGMIKEQRKNAVKSLAEENMQAKIDLVRHIDAIASSAINNGNTGIKGIRDNRAREQRKKHIDYVKECMINE